MTEALPYCLADESDGAIDPDFDDEDGEGWLLLRLVAAAAARSPLHLER